MDLVPTCFLCTQPVKREHKHHLKCSCCHHRIHYLCGLGYEDPVKAFRVSSGKEQYTCPICVVASDYKYLHMALEMHQALAAKAKTEPVVGDLPAESEEGSVHREGSRHDDSVHEADSVHDDDSVHDGESVHGGSFQDSIHGGEAPSIHSVHSRAPTGQGRSPLRLRDGALDHEDEHFRTAVSAHEKRRIKRGKGMWYGLKHIPKTVDTLIILDSNGRDIKAEEIDGTGDRICVRNIGGLCCAAATESLNQCKVRYPNIKTVCYGLGTNDHLHKHEHPGDKVPYLQALDSATKRVFSKAKVSFMLPFSGIADLGTEYVQGLSNAISNSEVGWKKLKPPSMNGKLVSPRNLHLSPSGRKTFTEWLRKMFPAPKVSVKPQTVDTQSASSRNTAPPVYQSGGRHSSGPTTAGQSMAYNIEYPMLSTQARAMPNPMLQNSNIDHRNSICDIAATVVSELLKQQRMLYGYHPSVPPGGLWRE